MYLFTFTFFSFLFHFLTRFVNFSHWSALHFVFHFSYWHVVAWISWRNMVKCNLEKKSFPVIVWYHACFHSNVIKNFHVKIIPFSYCLSYTGSQDTWPSSQETQCMRWVTMHVFKLGRKPEYTELTLAHR